MTFEPVVKKLSI